MKIYCISDNIDTKVGMRLGGIEGEIIHDKDLFEQRMEILIKQQDIAIILVTDKIVQNSLKFINNLRLSIKKPLILEIPDRHGTYSITNSISEYIHQAVGIKI